MIKNHNRVIETIDRLAKAHTNKTKRKTWVLRIIFALLRFGQM